MNYNEIATKFGTPLYVYDFDAIEKNYLALKNSFNARKSLVCFAVKANSNLSNDNEIYNIKNIDTPEELHFFYVNILLNGKEVEGKFEVSSSINN